MEDEELLTTGNTPAPKTSGAADSQLVDMAEGLPSTPDSAGAILEEFDYKGGVSDIDRLDANTKAQIQSDAAGPTFFGGHDMDYNYIGPVADQSRKNTEIQADRQGFGATVARGAGRLVGELVLNIAEIPGAVGGAIGAAGVGIAGGGQDKAMDTMVNNFWMQATTNLKEGLQDNLKVYKSEAENNGTVFSNLTSAAWWATEGSSAVAFMGAALVPGLGLAKAGVPLRVLNSVGKTGPKGARAIKALDKLMTKTPWGKANKVAGKTTAEAADIFNATMVNTVYEATVEAKGAMDSYEETIFNKYEAGEISKKQYENMLGGSSQVAVNTFAGNAALLLVPNAIMSKMMLGPRAASLKKLHKGIKANTSGTGKSFIEATTKVPTGKFAKAGKFARPKALGFAKDVGREGIVEEMGQMAIEHYNVADNIKRQMSGEGSNTWIEAAKGFGKEYGKVLQTHEGWTAAILSGIISAPMRYYNSKKENEGMKSAIKDTLDAYNSSANLYTSLRKGYYKTDANGDMILKDGKPEVDLEVLNEIGSSKEIVESMEAYANNLERQGDLTGAEIVRATLQTDTFMPFIQRGEEGITALYDMMVNNPATLSTVNAINEEFGSTLTVEEYANAEIAKAKKAEKTMTYYDSRVNKAVSRADEKSLGLDTVEGIEKAEEIKAEFNNKQKVSYTYETASIDNLKENIKRSQEGIAEAEKRGDTSTVAEYKKNIADTTALLEEMQESIKQYTDKGDIKASWEKYYKATIEAEKINSDEVTGYLKDIFEKVSNATTSAGVMAIAQQAKDEGLLLPGVMPSKLPAELSDMIDKGDLVGLIGAAKILNDTIKEGDTSGGWTPQVRIDYINKVEEVKARMEIIYKEGSVLFDSTTDSIMETNNLITATQTKRAELTDQLNGFNDALTDSLTAIEQLELNKKKGRTTSAYKKQMRVLQALATTAQNNLKDVHKEIKSNDKDLMATLKALKTKTAALEKIYSMMPKDVFMHWAGKKYKEGQIDKTLDKVIQELSYRIAMKEDAAEKANKPLSKVEVIPAHKIIAAIKSNPDLIGDIGQELAETFNDIVTQETLVNHAKYLDGLKKTAQEQLKEIKALIAKVKKWKGDSLENKDILAELYEQMEAIEGRLEIIEDRLTINNETQAISDTQSKGLPIELNEYISKVLDALQTGNTQAFTKNETPPVTENTVKEEMKEKKESNTTENTNEVKESTEKKETVTSEPKLGNDVALQQITHFATTATKFNNKIDSLAQRGNPTKEEYANINKIFQSVFKANTYEAMISLDGADPMFTKANKDLRDTITALESRLEGLKKAAYGTMPKQPENEAESSITDTINKSGLAAKLQTILDDKNRDLQEADINAAKEQAIKDEAYLAAIVSDQNLTFEAGDKVFWDGNEGVVRMMYSTEDSNDNALIIDKNGKPYVVSISLLSKQEITADGVNQLNLEDAQKEEDAKEERIEHTTKEYRATKIPIQMQDSPADSLDENGNIVTTGNPFYNYALQTRDKTKDEVRFHLINKASTEEVGNAIAALTSGVFNEEFPTKQAAMEYLAKNMPLGLMVRRGDGKPGGAGSIIQAYTESSKDIFMANAYPLRMKILEAWGMSGFATVKDSNRDQMVGVTASWDFQLRGDMNLEAGRPQNDITNLEGISKDAIMKGEVVFGVVKDAAKGQMYIREGSPKNLGKVLRHNRDGAPILLVKDNLGKTVPIQIDHTKLSDANNKAELDLIMTIVEDTFVNGSKMTDNISTDVMEMLQAIPGLGTAFGSGVLTYGKVYNTLVYPNTKSGEFKVEIQPGQSITLGKKKLIAMYADMDMIRAFMGNKFLKVGVNPKDPTSFGPLTTNSDAYMAYLLDGKKITTNFKEDAPLFIGKQGDNNSNYIEKVGLYMDKSSILYTAQPKKVEKVIKKEKPTGKKVKLNRDLKGVFFTEFTHMTQGEIAAANKAYAETGDTQEVRTRYDAYKAAAVKIEDNKAGNTDAKPCN